MTRAGGADTRRRASWLALLFAGIAVALTLLDDQHLGVIDGPVWRTVHVFAGFATFAVVGWTFGYDHASRGGRAVTYTDWLRWRACWRKQQWPSATVAGNWATLLGWKHGKPYEPYECRWCGLWHVATVRDEREAAA